MAEHYFLFIFSELFIPKRLIAKITLKTKPPNVWLLDKGGVGGFF